MDNLPTSSPSAHGLAVYACLLSARVPVTYAVVASTLSLPRVVVLADLYDLEVRGLVSSTCLPGGGVLFAANVLPSTEEGA